MNTQPPVTAPDPTAQPAVPMMGSPEANMAVVVEIEPTPEEVEAKKAALARRQQRLDSVAIGLETWFSEAVNWRSDAERQWLIDLAQFESGQHDIPITKSNTAPTGSSETVADYRRTGDNITRPAVLLATSRVSDMLFPTSDRNWDITPSPDAEIEPGLVPTTDEQGNPLDAKAIEAAEQEIADERCERMRTQIDDQLQESNYAGAGRDVIFDAMLYGTGVLSGPFPRTKLRRQKNPETGKWERKYEQLPTATVEYIDLFQFYPRPCRNIGECEGVFVLHLMTGAALRGMAEEPGFSSSQIRRALATEKRYAGLTMSPLYQRAQYSGQSSINLTLENRYPVIKYSGEMSRESVIEFTTGLLEEASIDLTVAAEIIAKLSDDDLISVKCETWFVNGIVIKMALRPVNANMAQYHVYNYEKRPDTVFGKGVPFVLREDQLATQQLWQAMMLNSMMSAGLQIAVNKGALEPMGPNQRTYDLSCTSPRVWAFTDEAKDVRECFQAWEVPSVIDKLMPVYERAKANGNEHAMLPAIAQGDATSATPTSSGLSMLMNAANIVTRQLAKGWDDDITTPLLNGFYDWNLEHGKEEAKGDYVVIPRGVSHLLVKDVQAQRYLFALQTYSANPEMAKRMKWGEWARMGMVVMEMDSGKLLKDEKTVEEEDRRLAEQPPQDPRILAEQNRTKQLEADAANAAELNQLKREELQSRERIAQFTAASDERVAQLNYMGKLADLDASERTEMQKIEERMQTEGLWAGLKAQEIAQKDRRDALEIQVEAPDPRLA